MTTARMTIKEGEGASVSDIQELIEEIKRQDAIHPAGYPGTRDGIRLGLASASDELTEAYTEWNREKRLTGQEDEWQYTREELFQAAAVIMRIVREI